MKKLNFLIFILLFSLFSKYVQSEILPSYDYEPITPQTWKHVSLEYQEKFGTTAHIDLLRPNWWLELSNANTIGNQVHLSIPEFGVEAEAKVTEITDVNIDTRNMDFSNASSSRPVIGKFKRNVNNVWNYTFSNGESIKGTASHRFYSTTRNKYIPIGEVRLNSEKILTESGKFVTITKKKHLKKEPIQSIISRFTKDIIIL